MTGGHIRGLAVQRAWQACGLGLEPLHALVGFASGGARRHRARHGRQVRRLRLPASRLSPRVSAAAPSVSASRARQGRRTSRSLRERLLAPSTSGDLLVEPREPVAVAAHAGLELVALGGAGRRARSSAVGRTAARRRQACCFGGRDAAVDAGALLDARLISSLSAASSLSSRAAPRRHPPTCCCSRSMSAANCARRRSSSCGALLGALPLRWSSVVARIVQPLQRGARRAASASRNAGSSAARTAWCVAASACSRVRSAISRTLRSWVRAASRRRVGVHPAQVEQRRLGLADVGGDFADSGSPAAPAAAGLHLAVDLADHVLDAGQVGLGGAQPQFGLVAAGMQAGDAGGLLEHAAALLAAWPDDLADLALPDQGRRARAGRGIGEQQLHVAGAHVLAVDAIGRARLALDAAGDLELVGIVEGGRRRAVGSCRASCATSAMLRAGRSPEPAKMTSSMSPAAHGLVRAFAHHPAQRLDQVGLAAAIRADDAGQAGLDHRTRSARRRT